MNKSKILFLAIFIIILIPYIQSTYSQQISTAKPAFYLPPTDDAFVVVYPDDSMKFQSVNTDNENFLNIWSLHGVSPEYSGENAITYLKFDLRGVDVESLKFAHLKIWPLIINFENVEEIELFYTQDNNWNESNITYLSRPIINSEPILTLEITTLRTWHYFDITEIVENNIDSEITLALNFKEKQSNQERVIEYSSNESIDESLRPSIVFTYPGFGELQEDRIAELEKIVAELQKKDEGGGCLIATATYGTELAPQVQQLREFRDNTILKTSSGVAFMTTFNQFYYSFSPVIADLERQNPIFKEIVKIGITPMIASLSLLNFVDIDSESKIITYGLGIILLNTGFYIILPFMTFYITRKNFPLTKNS